VFTNIGQPYSFVSGETIEVSVDGGAFQPVVFPNTTVTADDVSGLFNGAVTGATATYFTDAFGNTVILFKSDNPDGLTSSLEFRNVNPGILERLGIASGKYVGHWVAEPYGASEIRIRGLARGAGSSLTVSASAATLTRMGLTAGTFDGSDDGEVPVVFPLIDQDNPTDPISVIGLIPEVLEFGEVDPAVESIIEQFNVKSAGSNLGVSTSSSAITSGGSTGGHLMGKSRGVADAGKPIVANAFGLADISFLRAAQDDAYRFFKKFIRGVFRPDANSVDALVTSVIETPGAEGNPGGNSGLFWVDIDRPDLLTSRSFRIRFGKLGVDKTPFMVTELGITGAEWLIDGQDTGGDGTAFGNAVAPMKLLDVNTDVAGTNAGGTRFIPLTSSVLAEGDRTLRIMESEKGTVEPVSLFRQVNGRWTTTCGDGTTSFGDFNGTDAIQQALLFFTTHISGPAGIVLQLKEGTFDVDIPNGSISIGNDNEVTLVGKGRNLTIIRNTDTTADTITVGTDSILHLKNLTVVDTASVGSNAVSLGVGTQLIAEDTYFEDCMLSVLNGASVRMNRCGINLPSASVPCMELTVSDGLGPSAHKKFSFIDCRFSAADHNPVTRVSAVNGAGSVTRIRHILFDRCEMSLGTTTDDGFGNLTGNCGVLDLNSDGTDVTAVTPEGVIVDKITYQDCHVDANRAAGAVSILMHLIPQTNGVSFDAGLDFLGITRLEINGGRWLAPPVNTLFNPFTIFEIGTAIDTTAKSDEFGGLFIRNAVMGFSGSGVDTGVIHGSATADIDGTLYMGAGDVAPADFYWGAWALGGLNIELDNTDFVGFSQLADSSSIAIRWNRFKMRNCTLSRFKASGSGSAAGIFRIRPRSGAAEYFEIRDLVIRGRSITAGTWGNIFNVEPNAEDASRTPYSPMTWDNVHVSQFDITGSAIPSYFVWLAGDAVDDDFWNGSISSYRNITIKNCNVRKISSLLYWYTGSVGIQNFLQNTKINGNEAAEGLGNAVLAFAAQAGGYPQIDHIEIKDNRIWEYEDVGIHIAQDYWKAAVPPRGGQVNITGNRVFDCDDSGGGGADVQIYLSTVGFQFDAATYNQRVHGTIRDNDCNTHPLTAAFIKVDGRDGVGGIDTIGGGVNPSGIASQDIPLRGVNTTWLYSGADSPTRYANNASLMIYNRAVFRTP
jgi:hypothetical protein